jgi:hypothetical protein
VRIREQSSEKRIIFRLIVPNGGLNYHEILLARREGQVRPVDIYIYFSGERLTESIHRMSIAGMLVASKGAANDRDRSKIFLGDVEKWFAMSEAQSNGRPQDALDIFHALPDDQKKLKSVLMVRTLAAQQIDDATYIAALDEFRAIHPKDPSLSLLLIDRYLLRREFDEAHEAITALNEAVGNDPYLQLVHANAFTLEGKLDLARDMTMGNLQREPMSIDAHWTLIGVALAKREFAEVARLLTKVRDELGVQLADLKDMPDYAEFVKSPEYAQWLSAGLPVPLP